MRLTTGVVINSIQMVFMFGSDLPAAAEEQIVEDEAPLVVDSSKPFNMKKFRDSLRKPDCIMGKKKVVSRS